MKEIIRELIAEKGKELIAIGVGLLLLIAGSLAVYIYTQGGTPFVPEEVGDARVGVNRGLSRGIAAAEDLTNNLNELLALERDGEGAKIIEKVFEYKSQLSHIEEALADMPQDIQTIADQVSQIRPRNAGKALSEAMNLAAEGSMELLRLRQDMASLYDGLERRAKGEEVGEFNSIADRVNREGNLINSLYEEFKAKIALFKELTDS